MFRDLDCTVLTIPVSAYTHKHTNTHLHMNLNNLTPLPLEPQTVQGALNHFSKVRKPQSVQVRQNTCVK